MVALRVGILRLKLGRRNIAQRCEQALVIEPVDPFERRHGSILDATPRSDPMDHFGPEQSDDRCGERVIAAVADAADRASDQAPCSPVLPPR